MTYSLDTRRYSLPFRSPLRTAHGRWSVRQGILVRLRSSDGTTGYGEIAPIPGFGRESLDADEEQLKLLGAMPTAEVLASVPADYACVRGAIAGALRAFAGAESSLKVTRDLLPVTALLPAGRDVLGAIPGKVELGFRNFKWKVGVGDPADEQALLDDVLAALPSGAKLRLDANGAWDRRQSERWLDRCADYPIEHVEQPISPESRGAIDILMGLAGDYPTPVALDESLVGQVDIETWLGRGWPGVYVVKPGILGDPAHSLGLLHRAKARVVFSSSLETGVGARHALSWAFSWPGEARALGFGVWPLFQDERFDGPFLAPFWRWSEVSLLNPELLWNALS
ncbi:MAG: o-succinylbenzoate synthase [Opitutaceae bacterium]